MRRRKSHAIDVSFMKFKHVCHVSRDVWTSACVDICQPHVLVFIRCLVISSVLILNCSLFNFRHLHIILIAWIFRLFNYYKPSRRRATGWLYPPARPSAPVNHALGVTSRFRFARRRPGLLPTPAAGLRPSSVRARRLLTVIACTTAHVSHSAGQIHKPIIRSRLLRVDLIKWVSYVRPPVRTSVRPSVHKKFLQFQWNLICW